MHDQKYLRRKDAAEYLKAVWGFGSAQTLAKLACHGGGPAFHRAGSVVLYTRDALDKWAESRIGPELKSTSEAVGETA
ncbi:hypothetical protein [Methylocystis echinoides]|uniref:DNA-binding protein n=1 Tax=Methylocystis echinoides TaxID=29468 RepID=A0A9W6LT27_9HYPH|nr:hypothetical protein [Methylocystis echinoides]GLI94295.1 hypothetical protein LMG27198_32870 [Methylocystis echinoides]